MRKLLIGGLLLELPASPIVPGAAKNLSQNEVVPRINIRSPPLQAGKFVMGATKRLLQYY
jgi:hypothetical protein